MQLILGNSHFYKHLERLMSLGDKPLSLFFPQVSEHVLIMLVKIRCFCI